MSHAPLPSRRRLNRNDFLHFTGRQPLRLRADGGTLWVTQDGRPEDIEIDPGQSRDFDGQAPITVGALGGPALVSVQPLHGSEPWSARLMAALRRRWPMAALERAL